MTPVPSHANPVPSHKTFIFVCLYFVVRVLCLHTVHATLVCVLLLSNNNLSNTTQQGVIKCHLNSQTLGFRYYLIVVLCVRACFVFVLFLSVMTYCIALVCLFELDLYCAYVWCCSYWLTLVLSYLCV
jgi:hypothetical protein